MATYDDLVDKIDKASTIEDIFALFDKVYYSDIYTHTHELNNVVNSNILRLYKECKNPNEELLLKCLINLRGNCEQTVALFKGEADYKKIIASSSTKVQNILSIKNKYKKAWLELERLPKDSVGSLYYAYRITKLHKKMKSYGYIQTKDDIEKYNKYSIKDKRTLVSTKNGRV